MTDAPSWGHCSALLHKLTGEQCRTLNAIKRQDAVGVDAGIATQLVELALATWAGDVLELTSNGLLLSIWCKGE